MTTPAAWRLPAVFKFDFPATLYRISARPEVALRLKPGVPAPATGPEGESYVDPKHFDLSNYEGKRDAALRPYSFLHAVFRKHGRYQDPKLIIWEIIKHTPLPKDLVLFQTRFDQYSLHPAERMSLTTFNRRLNEFFRQHGKTSTRDEWVSRYTLSPLSLNPLHSSWTATSSRSIMGQSSGEAGLPSPKQSKPEQRVERVMKKDGTVEALPEEEFRRYAEKQIGNYNARRKRRHTGPMSVEESTRREGKRW